MGFHNEITFAGLHKARAQAGLAADLPITPDGLGDIYYASDTNTLYLTNTAGSAWVALAGSGATQVKVSVTDTTADYLGAKIVGGTNVSLTTLLPTGNSQIQINVPIDASVVTYTPSNAANWNGGVDPGNTNQGLDQLASRTKSLESIEGKTLVNISDVTYGYLEDKLVAGSDITLTTIGTTNKQIEITASGGGGGNDDNAQEMDWMGFGFDGTVTGNWLADGSLGNVNTSLYVSPTGAATRISSIIFNNIDFAANSVRLYLFDGVNYLFFAFVDIPPSTTFEFVPKSPLILEGDMELWGEAQGAGSVVVDYWISGGVRLDPITGIKPIVIYSGQPFSDDPLYTVPSGKTVIISYISVHIASDPGAPNGAAFDLEATSITNATPRQLYLMCLKYRDTQYFFPGVMMQDGDTLTGGVEGGDGDVIICGWITV